MQLAQLYSVQYLYAPGNRHTVVRKCHQTPLIKMQSVAIQDTVIGHHI